MSSDSKPVSAEWQKKVSTALGTLHLMCTAINHTGDRVAQVDHHLRWRCRGCARNEGDLDWGDHVDDHLSTAGLECKCEISLLLGSEAIPGISAWCRRAATHRRAPCVLTKRGDANASAHALAQEEEGRAQEDPDEEGRRGADDATELCVVQLPSMVMMLPVVVVMMLPVVVVMMLPVVVLHTAGVLHQLACLVLLDSSPGRLADLVLVAVVALGGCTTRLGPLLLVAVRSPGSMVRLTHLELRVALAFET